MNIFEEIIISIILLLFPILCYLFYIVANKNIDERHRDLVLNFTLISVCYIIEKFNWPNFYTLLLLSIPLFLMCKRGYKWIAYSLLILITIFYLNTNYLYFIIINVVLNILFNHDKNLFKYILIVVITSIIFILCFDIDYFFNDIIYVGCCVIVLKLAYYTVIKGEDIIDYHIEYKDLKKEHEIRQSLFKITHEIKNPLAVCKAYIDMFDYSNLECATKYIPIISREIDKLLILLQDFLLVNKDNINFDIMDVNVLLEDIISDMNAMNKFNIKLETIDDEIFIDGDYNRLTQVLTNLVKNSFEAHANEVLIKLSIKENKVVIEIIDDGDGISENDKEKIYLPFYTTKKEGTGLGVSLSKEIIEAHNGTLEYFDNQKGTTAKILLPVRAL